MEEFKVGVLNVFFKGQLKSSEGITRMFIQVQIKKKVY